MPKEKREKDRLSLAGNKKSTAKNGAGGKFTWGPPGSEVNIPPVERGDPMYDSEGELGNDDA